MTETESPQRARISEDWMAVILAALMIGACLEACLKYWQGPRC